MKKYIQPHSCVMEISVKQLIATSFSQFEQQIGKTPVGIDPSKNVGTALSNEISFSDDDNWAE